MQKRSEEQKETPRFDAAERARLEKARSFEGKYNVRFVNRPISPEIFEYVAPPKADGLRGNVYINLGSAPGANVSCIIYK